MKRTCISIFSKIGLIFVTKENVANTMISHNRAHKFIRKRNRKFHKFATTNSIFKKSILSEMHHRKTYMHINFQQNRVKRSVKTVHTNLFAKKLQVA